MTILVTEDDSTDRFLLKRAFRKAGSEASLHFLEDGQQTIDFLSRGPTNAGVPELLLLDLKMPCISGFEVLEWLLANPESRPAVVVVFSSSDHPADIERASQLGADHYLVKPSRPSDMEAVVRRLEQFCLTSSSGHEYQLSHR